MSSSIDKEDEKNIGRVALLQFKVSENKSQNHEKASEFLSKAGASGAKMAILPEIWNSPYATSAFEEYAESLPEIGDSLDNDKSPIISESAKLLMEKAKEYNMFVVGGSVPEKCEDGKIFNTCLCINPQGVIVGKHRKVHLFDIDVPGKITFKESDTLSPGNTVTTFDAGMPFGMVGVGICYDIRFPELAQCYIQKGCRVLIYPGAFNLTTGPAHWELLQKGRAVDGQVFVLTASPARSPEPAEGDEGKYPHYSAWGHSTCVTPWGEVLATCDEQEHVVICDLDMGLVDEMRQNIPTSLQKRSDMYELKDLTNN